MIRSQPKKIEQQETPPPIAGAKHPITLFKTVINKMGDRIAFLPAAVLILIPLFLFYNYYHLELAPQITAQIVTRVGELIVLPEGENPTIATVSDPERLRDQPFFAKAKVGDQVLIYTNAHKAILYDPKQHKILEVAPLNIGDTAQQ